jgi:UDP-N-acetyl-2-amino-2-deoxyglucuronate dehydrogenase
MSIRFALIGCGRIGQVHAREIRRVGKLVAVCDSESKKMDHIVGNDPIHRYITLKELFLAESDIDLVVIATPNGLHAQQSIECLNHGKHVLCEKPMAIRSADAEEMIKAARRANKHLVVVKQNRYNPPVQELKRLLDEGKLGKILSVQVNAFWNRNAEYYKQSPWRGTLELDGGTLYTQFSHFVDLMIWLFGDIREVKGSRSNVNHQGVIDFEDQGVIALQFESGLPGSLQYTVNAYEKNMEGSITVFGEKGAVKVGGAYLNEMSYFNVEGVERVEKVERVEMRSNTPNQYDGYQGSMSNHPMVYDDLIRLLNGESNSLASPEDGLRTVKAIEKIYSSIHVS